MAVAKGYRVVVESLESEDEREQLAAHVVLRVLLGTESNVSDLSRANGFVVLFRLVRGEIKASPKVLAQTMQVLRLAGSNRVVAIEIKSSGFEMDIAKHLGSTEVGLQAATLDAIETILNDEAGLKFCKQNNKLAGTLSAFSTVASDISCKSHAKTLLEKLTHN